MTTQSDRFVLGPEQRSDGDFVRQTSRFRRWVGQDPELPPAAGRYHLYVSPACPWSHRAILVRRLKRLDGAIGMSCAHPFRDARGWAFPGGEFADEVNGFRFLAEAYEATDPDYDERVTVPVLWDTETGTVVSNESADIIRMFGSAFDEWGDASLDLYPADLRDEIDAVNPWIYEDINNGVYRTGFAGSQASYDESFARLFEALDRAEALLAERRYIAGDRITEADWRLWVTLVRFDAVYHQHFRCNGRRIVDYPNLWGYTRELYQHPGVAETVAWSQIKEHYYTTHDMLNPSRLIAAGPLDLDFTAPHGRAEPAVRAPEGG